MSATKFPLVDRYELLDCKIFYDKEILEKKDFYNKVVVVNENDKLVLQEKKIFPIQFPFPSCSSISVLISCRQ